MRFTRIQIGRWIYFCLACVFIACISAQVLLAGLATFVGAENWLKHMMFAHLFGFNIPLIMLIFAFVGRFPQWGYWQLLGVFVTIFLMYFTANITALVSWLGAMHPVIAIILFGLSWSIVVKSWKLLHKKREVGENL
ncbi:DUF6220 domain-containing protein [Bacillus niameyensis]|uniref:DUF6220 domain-containing protein n=1 Tax=Bacillus niameyensis TaxID=1522308 RepID=UPI000785B46B|nr:DUF6220 domain-containing protein [Bacillus niameyensis]